MHRGRPKNGCKHNNKKQEYYLNFAPAIPYGLKRFVFKARFMILILTISVICLRVKITPTSLYTQGFLRLATILGARFR
jgi:hypothetical protein